jgi:hypothetical protein
MRTIVPLLLAALLAALAASPVSAGPPAACGSAKHSCFEVVLDQPGCDSEDCCATVCAVEPACCEIGWDELCVALAAKFCSACGTSTQSCLQAGSGPGCREAQCCAYVCALPGFAYCCDLNWDANCAAQAAVGCNGCGAPGAGRCNRVHESTGCDDPGCCAQVCEVDAACCELGWDETCVQWAAIFCPGCGSVTTGSCCYGHITPFCDDPTCCEAVCEIDPFCCEVRWDTSCVGLVNSICDLPNCRCGDPTAGSCKSVHANPGCSDLECCVTVCQVDPYCCTVTWDYACTLVVEQLCSSIPVCGTVGSGSCFVRHNNPGCDEAGCCERVCEVDQLCCQIAWDQDCADLASQVCTDCGDTLSGSCFQLHGGPACNDLACCENVCKADPFCCIDQWDTVCVSLAIGLCDDPVGSCGDSTGRSCFIPAYLPGCEDAGCCALVCGTIDPFCCEVRWDAACVEHAYALCGGNAACPGRGSCLVAHVFPGCNEPICCTAVCDLDALCCTLGWDESCAELARVICYGQQACPGVLPCNRSHGSPGCDDPACCNVVCTVDPLCCIERWDLNCVAIANARCVAPPSANCPCLGSCFKAHENPGCDDASCCAGVCEYDPACCEVLWDESCAGIARTVCCGPVGCGNWCAGSCFEPHEGPFCNDPACCDAVCDVDPFCCGSRWDGLCAAAADLRCRTLCGVPDSGSCFLPKQTPSCSDQTCCIAVCEADPTCCSTAWDSVCAGLAAGDPGDPGASPPIAATPGLCAKPKCGEFVAGDCCQAHGTAACADKDCCEAVCNVDPVCCDTIWDATCAGEARKQPACGCISDCGDPCAGTCCEPHPTPLCNDVGCCEAVCAVDPFCCDLGAGAWDTVCVTIAFSEKACNDNCPTPECGDADAGNCCVGHFFPNCSDATCCNAVCAIDSFCCDTSWDQACASLAGQECTICQGGFGCGGSEAGDCFEVHPQPFCDDFRCCALICTVDETCCIDGWDQTCADLAAAFCSP